METQLTPEVGTLTDNDQSGSGIDSIASLDDVSRLSRPDMAPITDTYAKQRDDLQDEPIRSTPRYELRSYTAPTRLTDLQTPPPRLTDYKQEGPHKFHFRELAVPLAKPTDMEIITKPPEDWLFEAEKPLFKPNSDLELFYKSLPKQDDLARMTNDIRWRLITDTHLPFDRAKLAIEQTTDPFFKPIYEWLKNSHLPREKRSRKRIRALAEDFILAGEILFKIN